MNLLSPHLTKFLHLCTKAVALAEGHRAASPVASPEGTGRSARFLRRMCMHASRNKPHISSGVAHRHAHDVGGASWEQHKREVSYAPVLQRKFFKDWFEIQLHDFGYVR